MPKGGTVLVCWCAVSLSLCSHAIYTQPAVCQVEAAVVHVNAVAVHIEAAVGSFILNMSQLNIRGGRAPGRKRKITTFNVQNVTWVNYRRIEFDHQLLDQDRPKQVSS